MRRPESAPPEVQLHAVLSPTELHELNHYQGQLEQLFAERAAGDGNKRQVPKSLEVGPSLRVIRERVRRGQQVGKLAFTILTESGGRWNAVCTTAPDRVYAPKDEALSEEERYAQRVEALRSSALFFSKLASEVDGVQPYEPLAPQRVYVPQPQRTWSYTS